MIIPVSVAVTVISILCLQAIIFAVLLVFKKPQNQADKFLALVLGFFALTALNLALFYVLILAGQNNMIPYLQLELLFGLGPSLYLFTKSTTDPAFKISKWDYLHFLPVVLEFIYYRTCYYRVGAISLTESPVTAWQYIFIGEQWMGTISASIYIISSVVLLYNYNGWVKNNYANLHKKNLNWLIKPVTAYASFWLVWHIIRLADLFIYADHYRDFYFYPMFMLLSAITCWIGFQGYINSQTEAIGFIAAYKKGSGLLAAQLTYPLLTGSIVRDAMEKDKLYLDVDLNMLSFSEKTGLTPKQVSKFINSELNMNFHEFVNQYRVLEFMERLKQPAHEKFNILGHAFESGFASKSTFNYIFKKYTNLTPKQYYQKIQTGHRDNTSEKMNSDD
jgi:AraC-like DNA-binding protein